MYRLKFYFVDGSSKVGRAVRRSSLQQLETEVRVFLATQPDIARVEILRSQYGTSVAEMVRNGYRMGTVTREEVAA